MFFIQVSFPFLGQRNSHTKGGDSSSGKITKNQVRQLLPSSNLQLKLPIFEAVDAIFPQRLLIHRPSAGYSKKSVKMASGTV